MVQYSKVVCFEIGLVVIGLGIATYLHTNIHHQIMIKIKTIQYSMLFISLFNSLLL